MANIYITLTLPKLSSLSNLSPWNFSFITSSSLKGLFTILWENIFHLFWKLAPKSYFSIKTDPLTDKTLHIFRLNQFGSQKYFNFFNLVIFRFTNFFFKNAGIIIIKKYLKFERMSSKLYWFDWLKIMNHLTYKFLAEAMQNLALRRWLMFKSWDHYIWKKKGRYSRISSFDRFSSGHGSLQSKKNYWELTAISWVIIR